MISLNRRRMLIGAAAAASVPALIAIGSLSSARAATPPASKQAPGFYRYKVGSIEVTAITDGARSSPIPEGYIRNANKEQINEALGALYLEKDKLTTPFTATVINTGPKLVVIDTGLGPAMYEQSKGAVGQLHTNLQAAGIDRNNVDVVIISHFHPDHINGLLNVDNKPAFPNAEIMVPAAEWAYWSNDDNMSKAPAGGALEGNFKNIRRVFGALGNKVTQYQPDKELAPGIASYPTYGHTLGHTSHIVSSGSAKVLVQADVTAGAAMLFVRNPGWHNMFDMEASMAEQTRRKLYDMAATEKLMIQAYHLPFPALVHVEKNGNGYREIPVPWNPTI
jgi:glyoxylase-like metal-dependent hydrolase (beta-lactamase superfamily II)